MSNIWVTICAWKHGDLVQRIEQQRLSSLERQAIQAKINMAEIMGDPVSFAVGLKELEHLNEKTTNVNIANSVVGAINTGTVRSLSVKMENLTNNQPTAEMGKALKELTTAVLSAENLATNTKNEIAEQLHSLQIKLLSLHSNRRKQW